MEATEEELIKRQMRMNKIKIVADIVLIVLIAFLAYYIIREIEIFKILGKDVCRMCEERVGATCFKIQP